MGYNFEGCNVGSDFRVRIEEVEPCYYTVFSEDGNETYHFGESLHECVDWCISHGAYIVCERYVACE